MNNNVLHDKTTICSTPTIFFICNINEIIHSSLASKMYVYVSVYSSLLLTD